MCQGVVVLPRRHNESFRATAAHLLWPYVCQHQAHGGSLCPEASSSVASSQPQPASKATYELEGRWSLAESKVTAAWMC